MNLLFQEALISTSNIISLVSAVIAILALFVGIHSSSIARKVATSDFQASETVKLETAKLISTLRTIMVKGVLYTQQDSSVRDDTKHPNYIDILPEKEAVTEFLHSTTALAFHSYLAVKSAETPEGEGQEWRLLFIYLVNITTENNQWKVAQIASKIEKLVTQLTSEDISELSSYLDDIPKAINELFSKREHDVLMHVLVDRQNEESENSDNFEEFLVYLIEEKQINDPDVKLFWSVTNGDRTQAEKALERGAKVHTTSGEIITRYSEYYKEFLSK